MIPNTPWLKTIPQFDDEAIASVAVRLAPMGRIDADKLLRLHLDMRWESVSAIAGKPEAIAELAALGSFDLQRLSMGAWKLFKDRVEFLGRELGWFLRERRRVAPARLAADGNDARIRNLWLVSAVPCDVESGEVLLDRCPSCIPESQRNGHPGAGKPGYRTNRRAGSAKIGSQKRRQCQISVLSAKI
jgi:hypothetical protein